MAQPTTAAQKPCFYGHPTHAADYRLTYRLAGASTNTNYYLCAEHRPSFSQDNLVKVTALRSR
jgi:hypothetical protein